MEIHPIRNDADHIAAVKRIEALMSAKPGTPQGDELDVLATLVVAYEAKHHPIGPPDAIEAILFGMEKYGLSRKDLEPMIGSRARVSEVLRRKRRLTLPMIRKLHARLNISAEVLIGAGPVKRRIQRQKAA